MNQRREGVRSPRRLRLRILPLAFGCLTLVAGMQAPAADDGPKLDSSIQRLSYMIGLQIGQSLRQQGFEEIDAAALGAALDDVFQNRRPRLTLEEMQAAQQAFQAERAAHQNREAADNLAAGEAFFASNTGNEGVEQTPDGLQYRVLRAGDGATPTAEDRVVVHYRGRLIDGTEFDSSYGRGEPTEF
ncbi:MAG: FKBP-type peptidyl-prolyl cis-trans isomerase, partial [Gammaproteobacteria bacterium]|nr:FKBP-type peptidyl-prolyl cis-trans isomerase [Gammaproteobacteria bacterium]